MTSARASEPERPGGFLNVIVLFKFVKAILFAASGVGMMFFRQEPVSHLILRWASLADSSPRLRVSAELLRSLSHILELHFPAIVAALLIAAAFLAAEGICLWEGFTWAPWFAIVLTGVWLPFEVFEMFRHLSLRRGAFFTFNLAVVVYLYRHRKEFHRHVRSA